MHPHHHMINAHPTNNTQTFTTTTTSLSSADTLISMNLSSGENKRTRSTSPTGVQHPVNHNGNKKAHQSKTSTSQSPINHPLSTQAPMPTPQVTTYQPPTTPQTLPTSQMMEKMTVHDHNVAMEYMRTARDTHINKQNDYIKGLEQQLAIWKADPRAAPNRRSTEERRRDAEWRGDEPDLDIPSPPLSPIPQDRMDPSSSSPPQSLPNTSTIANQPPNPQIQPREVPLNLSASQSPNTDQSYLSAATSTAAPSNPPAAKIKADTKPPPWRPRYSPPVAELTRIGLPAHHNHQLVLSIQFPAKSSPKWRYHLRLPSSSKPELNKALICTILADKMALAIPAPQVPKILLDLTDEGSIKKKLDSFILPSDSQQYLYLDNILAAINSKPNPPPQTKASPFANTEDHAYHLAVLSHNLPEALTTNNWYQILGKETQHFRVDPTTKHHTIRLDCRSPEIAIIVAHHLQSYFTAAHVSSHLFPYPNLEPHIPPTTSLPPSAAWITTAKAGRCITSTLSYHGIRAPMRSSSPLAGLSMAH